MSLEELEKKLYGLDRKDDGGEQIPEQKKILREDPMVQTTWEKEDVVEDMSPKKKGVAMKAILIGSLIALLGIGGVSYYYISEYYKTKDLVFSTQTVDSALIARPFDITVNVENKSQATLRDGKIFVKLPEGVIGIGTDTERQTIEESVGDMNAGEVIERIYTVAVVKDEQSTKKIDVNFSYLPQNINTRFEREDTLEVHVGQPAISLDFTTPQNVFSTEHFDIGMRYRNVSDVDFKDIQVKLITPEKVVLKSSSIKPDIGNATWNVATLAPQTEGMISAKGAFEGANQEFFELKSQVVAMFNGREYVINEKSANLGIAASPLSLEIVLNNDPKYIARPGDALSYVLKYKNNTDVGLSDVIIKAKLKGEMLDLSSMRSGGAFDSIANTLTWNAASVPGLKVIEPGAEGTVDFAVRVKQVYPIRRMFDKNYVLKVDGEINSPTVPYNVASDKTIGFAVLETKVGGDIAIETKIEGTPGSAPLQINKPSKYTVTWTIRNYSTDIRDVKMSSSLQPGIKWTGVVKSNSGAVPTYNDRTGELIWAIDKIIATKGAIGTPTEATFQVEITPNVTQAGMIEVTQDTLISATDDFTGSTLARQMKGLHILGVGR